MSGGGCACNFCGAVFVGHEWQDGCCPHCAASADMTIEQALFSILGDEAAHAIITDMGINWAIVAAMSAATTADDPKAIATIRAWNAERAAAA